MPCRSPPTAPGIRVRTGRFEESSEITIARRGTWLAPLAGFDPSATGHFWGVHRGGRGSVLPIDSLIVLAALRDQRRTSRNKLANLIQKDESAVKRTLEVLRERGLVTSHGRTKGATYTLSSEVYASLDKRTEYTRQAGFDRLQQGELVKNDVRQHGEVRRAVVVGLCHLSANQATRLLKRLIRDGFLRQEGERRWTKYLAGERLGGGSPT